jgi:tape measure domain-containing protein
MATERIQIIVSERGSRTVRRSIEDIGGGATRAEGAVSLLNRALGLIGGGLAVRELVRLADTYTNLQNRLRLVTSDTANLARVTDELFSISNRTRSSYESTAELYARVALSAKDLGRSQQELLQFTESLNQAVILSGASATEAEAGIIQLSQGLASGALQGDELRSVLEQLPAVADVIAQQLGVTRGELRQMGQEGKITADIVLDAFKNAREELEGKFATTIPTIGQSFTVLRNKAMELWGEFVTGNGIAQGLAQTILLLANNLDNIIPLVIGIGAAFAGWQIASAIAGVLGPMIALERALGATSVASALTSISIKGLQGAFQGLTLAIASNPLGALAVALTALITLFVAFGDDIKVTEDGLVSLKDVAVAAMQLIWESVSGVVAAFQVAWDAAITAVNKLFAFLGTTASEVFSFILKVLKTAINGYIGLWVLAFRTVQLAWNNFPGFMDTIFTSVVNLGAAAAEKLLNAWQTPLRLIAGGLSYIDEEASSGLNSFLDNFNVEIPRAKASDAGAQFARDFGAAANDAFSTDYVGNAIDAVMERARQNAMGATDAVGELNGATQNLTRSTNDLSDAEKKARQAFSDFLRDIEREIELLGLSNREAERRQMLFQLEDQMKRQLTQSELALANARITALQAARDNRYLRDNNRDTQDEIYLLQYSGQEHERRADLLKIERDLDRELTAAERELANARLDALYAARDTRYLNDYVRDLNDEYTLLQYTGREHNVRSDLLRIERDLGRELTDTEREWLGTLLEENEAMRGQNDLLNSTVGARQAFIDQVRDAKALLESGSGFTLADAFSQLAGGGELGQFFEGTQAALDAQLAQYQTYYDQVKQLRDANLIDAQSAAQALNQVEIAMLEARLNKQRDFFGTLAGLSKSKNKELAAIGKAAAVTQATIDGYLAVQKALSSFPPPFNFIAAAAVGAATAANVAGILSQNANFMTGGSMKVGGSGGPDSQLVAFRATPGEEVQVRTPTQVRKGSSAVDGGNGGGGSPTLNAKIVNVIDPALVGDFLETPEGEQVLINVMQRNGDTVRSIAQGG